MAKKIFLIVMLVFFLWSGFVKAQDNKNYLFHLYYDNGLSIDRDYPTGYEIVDEEYEYFEPGLVPSLRHVAELISPQDKVIDSILFDPVEDRADQSIPAEDFKKGKIIVPIPYLPNIQKVKFYDDKKNLLLTVEIGSAVTCNQDNVCNSEAGENWFSCISDCPAPSESVQPTETTSGGSIMGSILYIVGGLALAFVAWIIYRTRKNQAA